jgi:hypothetical protein
MKITLDEILKDDNLIGHMILNGIGKCPEIIAAIRRDRVAEVKMTVNGAEIELQSFVDHWQSQVELMIHEEAVKLVEDKFNVVRDKMDEFTTALMDAVDNSLSREAT